MKIKALLVYLQGRNENKRRCNILLFQCFNFDRMSREWEQWVMSRVTASSKREKERDLVSSKDQSSRIPTLYWNFFFFFETTLYWIKRVMWFVEIWIHSTLSKIDAKVGENRKRMKERICLIIDQIKKLKIIKN